MPLTNKYHLSHPRLMAFLIICMTVISAYLAINSISKSGLNIKNMLWGFLPMAFTLALSAHAKFPTKIGWWTLLVVMFAPIIWGTFDGLFQTYSLLVAKYSWADFFELMVIDLFVALVAALFLYSSGVAPVTEEGSTNESSGNYA